MAKTAARPSTTSHDTPPPTRELTLRARPPFSFDALLDFYRARAVAGVEIVDDESYARTFGTAERPGYIRVTRAGASSVRVSVWGEPAQCDAAIARARRMFDLDADPTHLREVLGADRLLRDELQRHPGQRLPGAWDGFELAVRAVLGQQVTVAAARTQAGRLVEWFGTALPSPFAPGLHALFPTPAQMVDAGDRRLGMPQTRANTLTTVARALDSGALDLPEGLALDEFIARWTALKGIGDWTAQYIAMRGYGYRDAFPAGDLILRRAAAKPGASLSERELRARAEPWRPYRAYAVLHLWRRYGERSSQ